jgi:hypothetical protein
MGDHVDTENPRQPRRWLVAAVTTVTAWFVAFLVVMALLTLFRAQLASLPVALRALVISGVLVTLMVNLVMPVLGGAVVRILAGGTPPRFASGPGATSIRPQEPQPRTAGRNDAGLALPTAPKAQARRAPISRRSQRRAVAIERSLAWRGRVPARRTGRARRCGPPDGSDLA